MTTESSLVSVVVPTFNSASTLEASLASIRSQLYQSIEIVVVDNHSTDDTLRIATNYADIVEICGNERSAQRNRGANLSHGEYLLFVDSDMALEPSVVADCVWISRHSESPAVVVPELTIGHGFLARCRALERSCYEGDLQIEAARFFTRAVFETVGGFDENLTALEDWDLMRRVASGHKVPRIAAQIFHNEGRVSLRRTMAKKRYYAASAAYYIHKHGPRTLGQGNLIFRRAYLRHWRRLARHPILSVGFLTLKTMETGAIAFGILETQLRSLANGPSSPA